MKAAEEEDRLETVMFEWSPGEEFSGRREQLGQKPRGVRESGLGGA